MNHHGKRACKELEALGCYRDHDAKSTAARVYRHPNNPDETFKVFDKMCDSTMTYVIRRAAKAADIGTTGPAVPLSIKERARIKAQDAKVRREAEMAAAERRADEAGEKLAQVEAEKARSKRLRELRSLMQPGFGR